ncbi:MAG: aldo/keto reductase [Gammaproteobacteria bacterium]|nr:aldo/keto reductase [Gammaproteobacteria bacterium]
MSVYLEQRKVLANTDVRVSPLGLGTVKLGRDKGVKYPHSFRIPDDQQALALLDQAWELGINLLDTAPAYGNSEQRLGELLSVSPKDWMIATKVGETFNPENGESHYNFSPEFINTSIQQSLKNLRRDYLDIVLIHSDGNDKQIIQHDGVLETLAELKQQGLIRAIGMSTKTVEGGLLALEQSDVVMVMHNLHYQQEQAVLDQALMKNKGVFIKKALASGHLTSTDSSTDIVQANFDFIFSHPAVSSIIIGTINPTHLTDNVVKATKALSANIIV